MISRFCFNVKFVRGSRLGQTTFLILAACCLTSLPPHGARVFVSLLPVQAGDLSAAASGSGHCGAQPRFTPIALGFNAAQQACKYIAHGLEMYCP